MFVPESSIAMMANPFSSSEFSTLEKLNQSFQKSLDDKITYAQKLEAAKGLEIYKYVFLLNDGSLREYISQSRMQAQDSFRLSKLAALAGLMLVFIAIILSVVFTLLGNDNLNPAYLGGIVGVVTELIAGVFFVLYSKTLSQINLFHDKLIDMQKTALSYIKEGDTSVGYEMAAPPESKEHAA